MSLEIYQINDLFRSKDLVHHKIIKKVAYTKSQIQ